MTTGEWRGPKDAHELLSVASRGIVVPGHEEYFEVLSSPASHFILKEPTAEEVRQREEQFALKVVFAGALMAVRSRDGIVTLMSDVDETFTEDGGETIRPAFPFALNLLHGVLQARLEVGVLTSIPQAAIDERLPTYFSEVSARVNPGFTISSHDRETTDPSISEAMRSKDFTKVEEIVDPKIIKGTKEGTLKDIWFDSKLVILQRLAQSHPSRAFVLVDDRVLASVIREDHTQVMGVWVGEEMQNDRRRVGRAQLPK